MTAIRAGMMEGAILAATFAIQAGVTPAGAGSASDWVTKDYFAMRLISDHATWRGGQETLVAGIQIKLDKGWKTYWRYPGDSGLPPRFDWSGSRNLKDARLLWPAPIRLRDSFGTSYGYKREVIFPVLIEPVKAGQPIDLRVKIEFAVCADICIPAEADLRLKVGRDGFFSRSYEPSLSRSLARVPGKQDQGSRNGLSVSHTEAQLSGAAPYLAIEARFPDDAQDTDLIVEGPEGFYLAPAEPVDRRSDGAIRFRIDLTKGDNPKDLKGKIVTLTLVSKSAQAETSWLIE